MWRSLKAREPTDWRSQDDIKAQIFDHKLCSYSKLPCTSSPPRIETAPVRDPGQAMKNIGDISIATAPRQGCREFSTRQERSDGSRRSLSIAARRARRDRLPPDRTFRVNRRMRPPPPYCSTSSIRLSGPPCPKRRSSAWTMTRTSWTAFTLSGVGAELRETRRMLRLSPLSELPATHHGELSSMFHF
jgi:hypothetical protein